MVSKEELNKQTLFEDIPDDLIEHLASGIVEISLKKGSPLFRVKDDTKGVYLIRSGKVDISKVTDDGWKQRIVVFSSGEFFGELSIMEKRAHEADADAIEDANLMLLPKEFFHQLETENLALAMHITKKIAIVTSKNLRLMNQRFLKAIINY